MKTRTILTAIVAASLLSVPALAAPPAGKAPAGAHAKGERQAKGEGKHKKGKRAGKGDPKQREARMLERLKKAGIDEARAKKLIAIHAKYRAEGKKLRDAAKPDREAFRTARKNKDEAAMKAAKQRLEAHRAKFKALHEQRQKEVLTVLTPAEAAKLKAMREKHHGKRGGHHGGKAKGQQS